MTRSNFIVLFVVYCLLVQSYAWRGFYSAISNKYNSIMDSSSKLQEKSTFKLKWQSVCATLTLSSSLLLPNVVIARPEGVNRPDLLPAEFTTVIDVANFLTKGQEKKVRARIDELEQQTGFKLRILCQSYPNTPGLAIKDYWNIDDKTVLVVADRGEGFNRQGIPSNIINLNLGKEADDALPGMFWSRLTNKLGNQPYVKKNGEDIAVLNVVEAISYCLTSKDCKDVPFTL